MDRHVSIKFALMIINLLYGFKKMGFYGRRMDRQLTPAPWQQVCCVSSTKQS